MKKQVAGVGVIALAWLVVQTAATSMTVTGCSSDDDSAADASDGSTDDVFVDPCALFTHSGDTCTLHTSVACFPESDIGGCFCLETTTPGVLRWACQTDTTCLPDGSPIDDVNGPDVITTFDSGDDDAGGDDASDASNDAGDGAIGDAADAGSDASAVDASTD